MIFLEDNLGSHPLILYLNKEKIASLLQPFQSLTHPTKPGHQGEVLMCPCYHTHCVPQPHTLTCPGYLGQRGVPEGTCAQGKALSGPKTPLSFVLGPSGDQQHWVLQQDKLTPLSWVLPGLGGLLTPHRQSKALGSRVVGKPAGPSSATPHEPA